MCEKNILVQSFRFLAQSMAAGNLWSLSLGFAASKSVVYRVRSAVNGGRKTRVLESAQFIPPRLSPHLESGCGFPVYRWGCRGNAGVVWVGGWVEENVVVIYQVVFFPGGERPWKETACIQVLIPKLSSSVIFSSYLNSVPRCPGRLLKTLISEYCQMLIKMCVKLCLALTKQ